MKFKVNQITSYHDIINEDIENHDGKSTHNSKYNFTETVD